jgi:hypothetical protein
MPHSEQEGASSIAARGRVAGSGSEYFGIAGAAAGFANVSGAADSTTEAASAGCTGASSR